jgi:ATP-binding cassette subfamily B protein
MHTLETRTVSPVFDLQTAFVANRLVGLWRLLTGFRLAYLGATTSQAIAALSKTFTYILLRYLVDHVLPVSGSTRMILWVALGFLGLALFEGFFSFSSGRLAALTAEGIARRLRNYMFDHIQRLTFTYHDKMETGELISRSTSDIDAIRRFFADQAIGVGRVILLFGINFTAIYNLNTRLAWLSIIIVPFIVVVSALFFKRISKAYEAYQQQEATLSTTLQENLTGMRVVKAFARQEFEMEKFEKDNMTKFQRGRRLVLLHATFWPVSDLFCAGQLLFGLYIGASMAINGVISLGTYLAYAGLIGWLIWPMRNLGRLIVQTSTGLVSYGRVREVISQQREPLDTGDHLPEDSLRGEVLFENVGFEYGADHPVLQDINLHCQPGQVIALLGSTGSGKTSLVNLLPRFYEYNRGSLRLDGVELKRYPRRYLRSQVGIVEQEPFLFSRSIRENITYGVGRDVSQEEIEAVARAAAIHDVIMTFKDGYDTLVGERGVTLSGGQKQRVAIARTLLKNPRILILDDATSSIDMETEAEIRAALERLMQGRTSFVIAHRIQSVMNADQIVVLDKGAIVQSGSHAELLKQPGVYQQVFDLQTRIEDELTQEIASAEEKMMAV